MKTELIRVNGIEMEYFSFGSGSRPFVILPGVAVKSVMQSAGGISGAYRMFAEDYTVYVFDRRKNMPDPYSVREMAADTAEVMKALGLADADIFGASQGGMMALCLAIDFPELVRSMVIGSSSAAVDAQISAGTDRWLALAQSGDMAALTAEMIDVLYAPDTIGKYKELLVHMNDHAEPEDIRRFIIQTQAIDGFDVSGELDRISCPVLVIGCEGDRVLPAVHSRRLAEQLNAGLYLYGEEYGHCVFDEAPDYKQRMTDFFKRV